MLSNGMFYLAIRALAYELQVEMYLIVISFVLGANISPAQCVARVILSWLLNQHFNCAGGRAFLVLCCYFLSYDS